MSLSPIGNFTQPQEPEKIIKPSRFLAKVLQVPVFRLALGNDGLSKALINTHNFFSRHCNANIAFRDFDPEIAQQSLDRFQALGAKVQFVTPRDGKGKVQMMTFTVSELEKKIIANGGRWERRFVDDKQVFAIIFPENPSNGWKELEEKLNHFHWEKRDDMFITCDNADLISDEGEKKCFFYAHDTTTSFTSDWERAGLILGAKQDLCYFDNGNTWKNEGRVVSEENFYLEAERVFDEIKDLYDISNIWIGGRCGSGPVAAYLKRLYHDEGVNFFGEECFADLDDFTRPISSFFAPRIKGILSKPPEIDNPPPTCHFGIKELWKDLSQRVNGKVVLIRVGEDEHLSVEADNKLYTVAQRVNRSVSRIVFASNKKYRHGDSFFRYEEARKAFFQAIFG